MSFVTHAQNKDASAFKSLVEEKLAEKVVTVLDALKIEVSSNFFNTVSEEGGVSGGVSRVWTKPTPPAKGTIKLPPAKEEDGVELEADRDMVSQGGNRQSVPGIKLPGGHLPGSEAVREASEYMAAKGKLKIKKAVQQDKEPHLPTKKGMHGTKEDRPSLRPVGEKD